MAESIAEGTLKQFSKNVGDFVEQDEEIATIETDKIDVAVNAPQSGNKTWQNSLQNLKNTRERNRNRRDNWPPQSICHPSGQRRIRGLNLLLTQIIAKRVVSK
ncbi:hypothetical protein CDD83_5712 [Cordyceps sp. RAO-2017]|nr:hypothetical protein CDD83_5712 [Cordyceps sp. RAO-2017]